jgi:hypothetical protein
MKLEAFERASEIREEMNQLVDLESLISNAAYGQNKLAALRPTSYALDAYAGDRIMNEEPLPDWLRASIVCIIHDKLNELRVEFETL